MYTACAALRLARFNVSPGRYKGRFEGLPSPPAAGMVLSTVLFSVFLKENGVHVELPASLPAFGLAGLGLLMVSPIPYHSFKNLRFGRSERTVVLMVIAFAVVLSQPAVTLFAIGIFYTASGPVGWYLRRRSGSVLEEISAPPVGEAEEGSSS